MTFQHAAQIAAREHADTARSLHLISLLRGRFDVLESAIAGQDVRTRLRVLTQIHDLFEELRTLSAAGEIA